MVGWSRRNRESAERRRRYYEWLSTLTPEEREQHERERLEEWRRERPWLYGILAACVIALIVLWFFR
jgi:ferric-dicitrate binding protein FerR (iron transport regulator)